MPDLTNPQTLNRYTYALNNPVKYLDPDGHCPRPPAGMGPAICLSLFIKPPRIAAGDKVLHGDGRDFSSDSDPAASRGYVWIPTGDPTQAETHMNQTGYIEYTQVYCAADCSSSYPIKLQESIRWEGPSSQNTWTVTPGDNGAINVSYDLVLAGDLEQTAPHINGTITFLPDGKGGYTAFGERDGFPWAEAYYHDGKGNVQTIFQQPAINGDPLDLYAIEKTTSSLWHNIGVWVLGNGRSLDRIHERQSDDWYWR